MWIVYVELTCDMLFSAAMVVRLLWYHWKERTQVYRDETARHMVEEAARLFKERYKEYPERIGLDAFTRMGEYAEQYGEWYCVNEPILVSAIDYSDPHWFEHATVTIERVSISIVPAIFGKPTYYPDSPVIQYPPRVGRDEVLCWQGERKVWMTVRLIGKSYQAMIRREEYDDNSGQASSTAL